MRTYTTIGQVIAAIKTKFADVKDLSRTTVHDCVRCLYGPQVNGIGCAIGCLVPPDMLRFMQEGVGIESLLRSSTAGPHLETVFSPEIEIAHLAHIQNMHDQAASVAEFLAHLDEYAARYAIEMPPTEEAIVIVDWPTQVQVTA